MRVQISWGVYFGSNSVDVAGGWLRTGGIQIHGIRAYMSREEAENEIVKDAVIHPERLGKYEIRPEYSEFCGNEEPCAICRDHLSLFKG